jgi:hypothetical protein
MYYVLTESYENGFSEEIEETTIVMISRDLKEIEAMKNRLIDIEEVRQYKHYQDCDLWGMLEKEWINIYQEDKTKNWEVFIKEKGFDISECPFDKEIYSLYYRIDEYEDNYGDNYVQPYLKETLNL